LQEALYYNLTGGPLAFTGDHLDFAAWQARGLDEGSRVANPCFADPLSGNFTITDRTACAAIGFVPFDLFGVGPRVHR